MHIYLLLLFYFILCVLYKISMIKHESTHENDQKETFT